MYISHLFSLGNMNNISIAHSPLTFFEGRICVFFPIFSLSFYIILFRGKKRLSNNKWQVDEWRGGEKEGGATGKWRKPNSKSKLEID